MRRPFESAGGTGGGPMKISASHMHEWATYYAKRGWSVIPLTHEKKAACAWKRYQTSRADEAQLRRWFLEGRGVTGEVVGIGIIGGAVSGGLAVRDFDKLDAYERWAEAHPDLAGTLPTVETPRPGRHVYFIAPTGTGTRAQGDGELRGEGAYVAAPPSLHPSGGRYTWAIRPPVGPLPTVSDLVAAGLIFGGDALPLAKPPVGESGEMQGNGEKKVPPLISCTSVSHVPHAPHVSHAPHVRQGGSALVRHEDILPQNSRIETAIQSTIPTGKGQRHRQIFALARKLRAIAPNAKAGDFKAHVRRWHTLALPTIGTAEWAETWGDFASGLERVKKPMERSALQELLTTTDAEAPPACAADYADAPALCRLVKLCRALQRAAGAGVAFYLGQSAAGAALGVDQKTVSRYLAAMQADGIIRRTYAGHTGKASEYVYTGDDAGGGA